MKRMKKMLALLLAMAMVFGLSMTALADNTAKITVNYPEQEENEKPVTLTYLQIIEPDQTSETGWKFSTPEIEAAYLEGYNQDRIEAGGQELDAQGVIAELIEARKADGYANSADIGRALSKVAGLSGFEAMNNPQTVTKAGVYAVKAIQEGYTYNNMAAYVGFGEATGENYPTLQDTVLNAKRSKVVLDKSHDDKDKVSAIGQIVTYTIKTNVPFIDPGETLVNKTYYIHDEITGAEYVLENNNVKGTVTLNGTLLKNVIKPIDPESNTADGAFEINLSDLITPDNANAGLEVVVTYEAKVTAVNVDNTAKAGHKDGDKYGFEYGTDDEDVYTGKITLTKTGEKDTEKLANAGFEVTDEEGAVVYFTKDSDGVYSHVETADIPADIKTALDAAAEAKSVDMTELEQTADGIIYVRQVFTKDSDKPEEKGTVVVQGLNVGTYTFTEKTAPEGYSINGTPATATLEVTEANGGVKAEDGTLVATKNIEDTTGMSDTRLSELPSTGGIGTTIFTIGGCAIMIIAAGLYFASRRKSGK